MIDLFVSNIWSDSHLLQFDDVLVCFHCVIIACYHRGSLVTVPIPSKVSLSLYQTLYVKFCSVRALLMIIILILSWLAMCGSHIDNYHMVWSSGNQSSVHLCFINRCFINRSSMDHSPIFRASMINQSCVDRFSVHRLCIDNSSMVWSLSICSPGMDDVSVDSLWINRSFHGSIFRWSIFYASIICQSSFYDLIVYWSIFIYPTLWITLMRKHL